MKTKEYSKYLTDKYGHELANDILVRKIEISINDIVTAESNGSDTTECLNVYRYLMDTLKYVVESYNNFKYVS